MSLVRSPTPLQVARLSRGWSRTELAQEAGVTPQTVARVESGGSPLPSTRFVLAEALGVPRAELFPSKCKSPAENGALAKRADGARDGSAS
jgi:transcriptional regulator with XRE-family HTH domain